MASKMKLPEAETQKNVSVYTDPNRTEFLKEMQIRLGLWDGNPESPVKRREPPPWRWVPNDRWMALRGILSDHPEHDTTEMKRRNREEEEEHDARKFGRSSDR